MTLTEQVKILDDKIKANKAQYDLDRQAAIIFTLSSGELEKYEYLTGEGLLKKLKNIDSKKNEQQLKLIKNQGEKQLNLINKSNFERESNN